MADSRPEREGDALLVGQEPVEPKAVDLDGGVDGIEYFSVRYSPDGKLVACGCGDGVIRVFNRVSGKVAYKLNVGASSELPITCVRFRPQPASSSAQNIVVAACADGSLQHFHASTQQRLHRIDEPGNEIYAIDFTTSGDLLASAGHDGKVRLYDETNKALISVMGSGPFQNQTTGHASRVFSVRFMPYSKNVLVSGGWDNTIQIWDVRTGRAERYVFGPHIAGDALDVTSTGRILTGSWRTEDQLQLWDLSSGKMICDIAWRNAPMVYAVAFSANGTSFVAGGTSPNSAAVFDLVGNGYTCRTTSMLPALGGVYSAAINPSGQRVLFAGAGRHVRELTLA
ncbi:Anaphase-promoting complex subunit 4-like WD40 domain-containing protein [Plasmodiophora brassicae]|uniref:Anaphase-promoting complex subunit 4-like WD40 domain-containing protein n=1 Tax=Plasmodiophora brassicae TaxID=37360 RepID=A0A0G4J3K2_PLABS|nr:hypothetical protein PBRA_008794 [Plasmodiophora brassicae]SPQ96578.1 unnamed protein product [Plasmodiophora brassicae]